MPESLHTVGIIEGMQTMNLGEMHESAYAEHMFSTASFKLIYVFSIPNSPAHVGKFKVGQATLHTDKGLDEITQQDIDTAARKRINEYTKTAEIGYDLHHTELAIREEEDGRLTGFTDYNVHDVLIRSGFPKAPIFEKKRNSEWFSADLFTIKAAIAAVKDGKNVIPGGMISNEARSIKLRDEQEQAIVETIKVFNRLSRRGEVSRFLWNAKMRFGKTITALMLAKRLFQENEHARVLINSHRVDVHQAWFEDFFKTGLDNEGWTFGSKQNKDEYQELVNNSEKLVWFASMQDARGSFTDADTLQKNEELFETEWDLVITDEVHEGTLTELAGRVFSELKSARFLDLSGTPFNVVQAHDWDNESLAERFSYDGQYNWSYIDERRAKNRWEETHADLEDHDQNPYGNLPEIRFVTYDIHDALDTFQPRGSASADISFSKLFEVYRSPAGEVLKPERFIHEEQVLNLLAKMRGDERYSDDSSLFPYHQNFANYFNHTLWVLNSVPACNAMEILLADHRSGFAGFAVVNATGEGRESWGSAHTALEATRSTIFKNKHTITLSQQMLTTGVSVPEWTAVFMLNNIASPMLYMQAAFRATTSGSLPDGRVKDAAYVFDFNPDRCLREIVENAQFMAQQAPRDSNGNYDAIQQDGFDKQAVEEHLRYISVLSLEGSKFVKPNSVDIMEKLNDVYITEILQKGFDSPRLWNNVALRKYDLSKARIMNELRKINGKVNIKDEVRPTELDDEDRQRLEELRHLPSKALSEDERAEKQELNEKDKQDKKTRNTVTKILVSIATRMPMLVYASPANVRITPQNFHEQIDDESWAEFMPDNLKRIRPEGVPSFDVRSENTDADLVIYWEEVQQFFDPRMFSLACERVSRLAKIAAEKPVYERIFRTVQLFNMFRNPDKETVLTPWRVVNMQYATTVGGAIFLDLDKSTTGLNNQWWYVKNLATGEIESHLEDDVADLLEAETHEISPQWLTSDADPVAGDYVGLWEDPRSSFLDLNSKTALYPLLAAASRYYAEKMLLENEYIGKRQRMDYAEDTPDLAQQKDLQLWKDIVEKCIFLNCRVRYSALIARRVLVGFDEKIKVNASNVDIVSVRHRLTTMGLMKTPKAPRQRKNEPDNEYHERVTEWQYTTQGVSDDVWRYIFDVSDAWKVRN